jgi:putative ABC transport system permease protein
MFKNYVTVAFRNLLKNKVFTLINIIGLGIALSVCIVAFFNHMFNYEFDRGNVNFDKIYRITCFRDMQGREQEYGIVPATLGIEVKKDIPGIEKSARLMRTGSPVKVGNNIFDAQISYIDPEFLDIFTFPRIDGDMKSISDQSDVLISQKMAGRLFGKENPVGKYITILNDEGKPFTFTVSAVFTDLPENCSFRIDVLSHYDNFLRMWNSGDADWKLMTTVLFVMVPDKSTIQSISRSMLSYLPVQNRAREDFKINRFNILPMKDVGKTNRTIWSSGLFPSLHPAALLAPTVMALFILLIACFNFANTSRSIFSKRLKEIGLRKTFGGFRRQLVTQFMLETLFICLLSLITAIILAEFLVPAYSNLWNYMSIELTFTKYGFFWLFLVILVILTGFISGVYPALYVSSFKPVSIFKGDSSVRGTGRISMILLTLQFSISVMALVLGVVFWKNANYQRTLDLGYDRSKLIVVPVPPSQFTSLRNEIITNSRVVSAAGTQNHIGWGTYRRPVKDQEKRLEVDMLDVGPEYAQTMGLRLLEGRLFDKSRVEADRSDNSIVVNRKFVEDMGWKVPVGNYVTMFDTIKLKIIGVVNDFYTSGMWQKIEPSILRLSGTDQYRTLAVRAEPGDLAGVLDYIEQKWKILIPDVVFGGQPQEDTLREEKNINMSILKVDIFLALIASLLSLIGMYNMVSIDIIKKTKEIGIRKIQGAPVTTLMFIIGRKFIIVLLVASVIGCAGGYYLSLMLLDSIWDYFVKIGAGILLFSASIMIAATVFTIVFKILRAAMQNPAESLRYE